MKKSLWLLSLTMILCITSSGQIFTRVKDINPGPGTGIPQPHITIRFTDVNGKLFFVANNGISGNELWKTDGTSGNTVMVKDVNSGVNGSDPLSITELNGAVVFVAIAPGSGSELWKSDGTEVGTVLLKDINPGSASGPLGSLIKVNNIIYFCATEGANGYELWRTDGTPAGTKIVKDIYPGTNSGNPQNFANVGGTLYFYANNSNGNELWKSDGTPEGTMLVKDIYPGPGSSLPQNLTGINNLLYFYANNGVHGQELWESNGTEAGTKMIKDIKPGSAGSYPESFTDLDGRVIFTADDPVNGTELWMTDGTEAGTVIIKDIFPGPASGSPVFLQKLNNSIFFIAGDAGPEGRALWKTDGQQAGTHIVKDIWPGTTSGSISKILAINNKLFFIANDMASSAEDLWSSNGSEAGTTRIMQNINNNNFGSHWLLTSGTKLFLDVTDDLSGREFWAAEISALLALPGELSDLRGQLSGNDGILTWKTRSEQNTSHFEIQRSVDGREFITAGTVPASGNTVGVKEYSYTDRNIISLSAAVVYYRLQVKDVDGKSTYSKVIAINTGSKGAFVMIYPNPARENATMMIAVGRKENISYSIIDQHGRTVQVRNVLIHEGSNMIQIETGLLSVGVYTVVLRGEDMNTSIRLVKQ